MVPFRILTVPPFTQALTEKLSPTWVYVEVPPVTEPVTMYSDEPFLQAP